MSSHYRAIGPWLTFAFAVCILPICACSHGERHARCDDASACQEDENCTGGTCQEDTDMVRDDDAQVTDSALNEEEEKKEEKDAALAPPDADVTLADAQSSAPFTGAHDSQMAGESPFKGSWLGKTSSGLNIGFTVTADGTIDSLILFVSLRVGLGICTAPALASARASISAGAFEVPLRFPAGLSTGSISGVFAADAQSVSGSYARIENSSIVCGSTLTVGTGLVVASGTFTAQRGFLLCRFANDGVCDEPEGSGACLEGADRLDCDPACVDGSCDAGVPPRPLLDAGGPPFFFDASIFAPFFDGGLPPFLLDGSPALPGLDASLLSPWPDAASPFTFVDGGVLVSFGDGSVLIPLSNGGFTLPVLDAAISTAPDAAPPPADAD
jgi:hypothetical protein